MANKGQKQCHELSGNSPVPFPFLRESIERCCASLRVIHVRHRIPDPKSLHHPLAGSPSSLPPCPSRLRFFPPSHYSLYIWTVSTTPKRDKAPSYDLYRRIAPRLCLEHTTQSAVEKAATRKKESKRKDMPCPAILDKGSGAVYRRAHARSSGKSGLGVMGMVYLPHIRLLGLCATAQLTCEVERHSDMERGDVYCYKFPDQKGRSPKEDLKTNHGREKCGTRVFGFPTVDVMPTIGGFWQKVSSHDTHFVEQR
nr:hypothetical protein CFP56_01255 [Quercus suber]